MTPKEAAHTATDEDVSQWLHKASPRDIEQCLYFCGLDSGYKRRRDMAHAALDIRLAEDTSKSAAALENYTRTLIRLTWALVWLTVAILIFTICLAVRK